VTVPQPRLAVAVSGGRDSTALLHCTLRQARPLGIEVWALHVHHGLMPQADAWQQQVQRQSRRWGARFDSRRLDGQPARGDSVEAWAREGRYRALADMAQAHGCSLVLLAHHRLDQAETFVLQALRGAGVAGLAAMPAAAQRQGLYWARPWLSADPEAIEGYVKRHRLQHVQDPSNADPAFLRSRLRQQVWPVLSAAFPQAQATLAAAATHAQDAQALANEVAETDLQGLADERGLRLSAWQALGPARRRNALRAWLHGQVGAPPPRTLVDRLMAELPAPQASAWPAPGGELRRHRDRLSWQPLEPDKPLGAAVALGRDVDAAVSPQPCLAGRTADLSRPGSWRLPGLPGVWHVSRAQSGGLAAADLRAVLLQPRQGGERFRLRPDAPSRSLKQQFQTAGVPAWQRQGPLVWHADGRLLFVPGLGVEGHSQAPQGRTQLQLRWEPEPATAAPRAATGQRQRPG
jgi:tRNA(Ile)-lysidine synthase